MKMLRFLSITYVLMGVLQLPLLVSYIIGDSNVDAADETSGGFEIMSLANVPQLNETLSWGSLNQKQGEKLLYGDGCDTSSRSHALLYSSPVPLHLT